MLCFSKNCFFQIFDRSNLLLDRSKMWQKIRFESAWLDRFLIGTGSIQCDFWPIKSIFSTDRKSVRRCFKRLFSHAHHTVHTFSKAFSLSFLDRSTSNQFFVVFFLIFLQGFCLQVSVRPYYPFFFILFTFFIHIRCNFWTYRFLGFFIFVLVSFQIDHWVFVLRCYKHVSHALILLGSKDLGFMYLES